MEDTPDHYATLGVPPTASSREIRSAYRQRSRELHPDRNAAADAHRRMAALNAAYAVLADPRQRETYDLHRPRTRQEPVAPRPPATPPTAGRGSLQPAQLPDWYSFLGVERFADPAVCIQAINRLGKEIRRAGYGAADEAALLLQVRAAGDVLTHPRSREIYNDALEGVPPPAGTYPAFHATLYSFLGLPHDASFERIADRATALSGRIRQSDPAYAVLQEAWRTLRDPKTRAEYDATL
jgi:curved DNA-binding protein CbpA